MCRPRAISSIATLTMVVSNATMTTPTRRITASLINSGSSGSLSAWLGHGAFSLILDTAMTLTSLKLQ